ncbi:MAG: HlyD family type I secretion periplasmic adaptor subunit [Pseudomonadota bacterium]
MSDDHSSDTHSTDDPSAEEDFLGDSSDVIIARASRRFLQIVIGALSVALIWAATAELDRVTRGTGRIVSQEKNNFVQHFEGGIITQILISEGEQVAKGDVLLRIENSFAQAELAAAALDLNTAKLKRSRLFAEANGLETVEFDGALAQRFPAEVMQQTRFFERRRAELTEALSIVDDQVNQKDFELSERKSRLENKKRERALMSERLGSLRKLSKEGAVSRNELLENETRFQQVLTQISDLEFQIPQVEAALEEVKGRRREAELAFVADAERELTEVAFEISKLEETIEALRDRNTRFDVLAPTSGVINKLFVNNINGVVRPGENIAEIVPDNASIEVEAKLSPRDRANVWPGLPAVVKVSAYDYATHGGLAGKIVEVSPDALKDEDGRLYFRVRIEAESASLGDDKPVLPGMVAEVDIITGKQTILAYLLKPIREVQAKALRE